MWKVTNFRLGALLVVIVLGLLAAGCGTARYLQKTPTGGTLELEGDPAKANAEAKRLMADHCRSGYKVVSEGERFTGTEAERRQATKMAYACKAPVKKAAAPVADAPAPASAPAPAPAADVPDAGPSQ